MNYDVEFFHPRQIDPDRVSESLDALPNLEAPYRVKIVLTGDMARSVQKYEDRPDRRASFARERTTGIVGAKTLMEPDIHPRQISYSLANPFSTKIGPPAEHHFSRNGRSAYPARMTDTPAAPPIRASVTASLGPLVFRGRGLGLRESHRAWKNRGMLLRQDKRLWVEGGRTVWVRSGRTRLIGSPLSPESWRYILSASTSKPQLVTSEHRQNVWYYKEEWYWADPSLEVADVQALADEKERQKQAKIEGVRMRASGRIRAKIPPEVVSFVWQRDEGKCVRCGSREKLELDHIIPLSKGGSSTARNLQILCESCNREKSARI